MILLVDVSSLAKGRDRQFHVKIGSIELGVRRDDDPDTSKPNPSLIEWTQEPEIAIQKVTGGRPVTILTEPIGLWYCTMEFNTLNNKPEVLQVLLDMHAGPRRIVDYDHDVCMLLKKKKFVQRKGTDDWYRSLTLEFVENNPGVD